MPSSSKPRKKHRPRLVARPVYAQMHRDLVTPPRAAILALERVSDRESLVAARHTLSAFLSYMAAALDGAGYETGPVVAGMAALQSVIDREKRTGAYRASGSELIALRDAVNFCDDAIPMLDTAKLAAGMLKVDAVYRKLEAPGC